MPLGSKRLQCEVIETLQQPVSYHIPHLATSPYQPTNLPTNQLLPTPVRTFSSNHFSQTIFLFFVKFLTDKISKCKYWNHFSQTMFSFFLEEHFAILLCKAYSLFVISNIRWKTKMENMRVTHYLPYRRCHCCVLLLVWIKQLGPNLSNKVSPAWISTKYNFTKLSSCLTVAFF